MYNDLKLDNIIFAKGFDRDKFSKDILDKKIFMENKVKLIDFGFATSYVDKKTGKHVNQHDV